MQEIVSVHVGARPRTVDACAPQRQKLFERGFVRGIPRNMPYAVTFALLFETPGGVTRWNCFTNGVAEFCAGFAKMVG